jgi:hypothetical protein
MLNTKTILGIKVRDPNVRGRLYLAEDNTLTRDPLKARQVPDTALQKAIKEVKVFSRNFFTTEVACPGEVDDH